MARVDIFPFSDIGTGYGERYPDWVRGLKASNGVYVIRERRDGVIAYVGESHTDRLYGTLTRHFQAWSPRYETAGPTYDRADVEVAAVIVVAPHALALQNDLICSLEPRDNRLVCGGIYEGQDETIPTEPPGYDYDVAQVIQALFYEHGQADDVPF